MQTVIILIHLMIVLAMVGLVLLQKSEGGGLGMGGGGRRLHVEPRHRQRADPHHRILAALFFATSLFLSILAGFDRKPRSILDSGGGTPAAPGAPAVPGARAAACSTSSAAERRSRRRRRRPHRPGRRCRDSEASARAGEPALRF